MFHTLNSKSHTRTVLARLSKKTIRQLIDAKFFQTDHILSSICDDPENFFLMPAPLNNRFSIQSRQNFKIEFCGVAWDRAVFFVDKALEMWQDVKNDVTG